MPVLWAPLEVSAESARFYAALDLPVLETFDGGVIYDVGGGRLEIVTPASANPPPPIALEADCRARVDELYSRLGGDAPPAVFPRGHYGFIARDPDGNPLLMWSEK
jgi:hypothetical protein